MSENPSTRPHQRTFGMDHPIGMLFVCLNALQKSQCRKLKQLKLFRIIFGDKHS
ncbi:MAG: hypothetical protein WCA07_15995 [Gloeobacterales cyanobacterium]